MTTTKLRVVSLLPSATELLCTIGGELLLVGRSHECDFPKSVQHLPVLTAQKTVFTTPRDVDEQVRTALHQGESLYSIDEERLAGLRPDVILTQSLCDVCSISLNEVVQVAKRLSPRPKIVSLNPHTLGEVLDSLIEVGQAVGLASEATECKRLLEERVKAVERAVAERGGPTRTAALLEWTDPLYIGGCWNPELIAKAGGLQTLNSGGGKSVAVPPLALAEANPDKLIVAPCGLDLPTTAKVLRDLEVTDWWGKLRAVQSGNVALVDGNQFFNRPGPRLVETLEWLSEWLTLDGPKVPQGLGLRFVTSDFAWEPYRMKARDAAGVAAAVSERDAELVAIEEAHQAAMQCGKKTYTDPKTGFMVFTAQAALDRGWCCGRACRHCPYGHFNCDSSQRRKGQASTIRAPTLMRQTRGRGARSAGPQPDGTLHVVFWSGGKDSFLAYQATRAAAGPADWLVLVNTFDPATSMVPEQDIEVAAVMDQAKALGEDLMVIPLAKSSQNDAYTKAVEAGLQLLAAEYGLEADFARARLVFGDLHLADIRAWREASFAAFQCVFPLFGVNYDELAERLFSQRSQGVSVRVSACSVEHPQVEKGVDFDEKLFRSLQAAGIDAFGECGEFHTEVGISVQRASF